MPSQISRRVCGVSSHRPLFGGERPARLHSADERWLLDYFFPPKASRRVLPCGAFGLNYTEQGCGIKGFFTTSVIQGHSPLYMGG